MEPYDIRITAQRPANQFKSRPLLPRPPKSVKGRPKSNVCGMRRAENALHFSRPLQNVDPCRRKRSNGAQNSIQGLSRYYAATRSKSGDIGIGEPA